MIQTNIKNLSIFQSHVNAKRDHIVNSSIYAARGIFRYS